VSGAFAVAERLRRVVDGTTVTLGAGSFLLSLRIGVVYASPSDTLETILERAEQVLDATRKQRGEQVGALSEMFPEIQLLTLSA
jgi:GGDEF domain-containing protein